MPVSASHTIDRILIGGTASGVGKTTVALGLAAALAKRGLTVQPFKVGPDFIDPGYLSLATGNACRNLDGWMMGHPFCLQSFERNCRGKDIAIIEGVMGLYDGFSGKSEEGSSSQIAKWLGSPVCLVVDARSMARTAGALVYGFEQFDKDVNLKGVVFNFVGSARHLGDLRNAVEQHCQSLVLGGLPRNGALSIPERHLGLVTAQEKRISPDFLERLTAFIEEHVDIESLIRISRASTLPRAETPPQEQLLSPNGRVRIGVAYDEAFSFYYHDNWDLLRSYGAELVFFSPLKDEGLPPNLGGIYLGGGYPELHAPQLESNRKLRREIRDFGEAGLPIYAECGGFMYLGRSLTTETGRAHTMVGLFPIETQMSGRLSSLGYVKVRMTADSPVGQSGDEIRGHEFHYSTLAGQSPQLPTAYEVARRGRAEKTAEGFLVKNTVGSYIHLHWGNNPQCARRFVLACAEKSPSAKERVT